MRDRNLLVVGHRTECYGFGITFSELLKRRQHSDEHVYMCKVLPTSELLEFHEQMKKMKFGFYCITVGNLSIVFRPTIRRRRGAYTQKYINLNNLGFYEWEGVKALD